MSVPAGTYLVRMQSFDDSHPAQGTQPQEQWVARFFGAGGFELQSEPISDLPDDQITLSEVVGEVTFSQDITSVVARHLLYGGPYPTPESIDAVCLSLTPSAPPQGKILIQKTVFDNSGSPSASAGFGFSAVYYEGTGGTVPTVPPLVTDASGMDMEFVEPGTYTVTETDARGLQNLGGFVLTAVPIDSQGSWDEACVFAQLPTEATYLNGLNRSSAALTVQ